MLKKTSKKAWQKESLEWFLDKGWEEENLSFELLANQLEEMPFKPSFLVRHKQDGDFFAVAPFLKGEFFNSKSAGKLVTGIDWYKYKFLLHFEEITGIPVAMLVKDDEADTIIFKPLINLEHLIKWHRDATVCNKHALDFVACWIEHSYKIKEQKDKKMQPMAMWPVEEFTQRLIYQGRLM